MESSEAFVGQAAAGLADAGLQRALAKAKPQFVKKRGGAVERLPEFEALRDVAAGI